MSLNAKQFRFVQEYLKDFNATQAAIRAGYSVNTARSIASENLTKPDIKAEIARQLEEQGVNTQRVLAELIKIAFFDFQDLIKSTADGDFSLKPFAEMPPGTTRVIKKLKAKRMLLNDKEGEKWSGGDASKELVEGEFTIEVNDKLKALELLGRHLAMFNDKLKVQGDSNNPIHHKVSLEEMTEAQLDAFIQEMTKKKEKGK